MNMTIIMLFLPQYLLITIRSDIHNPSPTQNEYELLIQ